MNRAAALTRLVRSFAVAARSRALDEARQARWRLPDALNLHLWLYERGLAPPTKPERDHGSGDEG